MSAGVVVVKGREYEIPDKMKTGELRFIKQVSGLRPTELMDALRQGDPDLILAFTVIAMRRAGRQVEIEDLDDLDFDEIEFRGGEEEAEPSENPPAPALEAVDAGSPATIQRSSGNRSTSLSSG